MAGLVVGGLLRKSLLQAAAPNFRPGSSMSISFPKRDDPPPTTGPGRKIPGVVRVTSAYDKKKEVNSDENDNKKEKADGGSKVSPSESKNGGGRAG